MTSPHDPQPQKPAVDDPVRGGLGVRAQQERVAAVYRRGRRQAQRGAGGIGLGVIALTAIWAMAAAYYLLLPPVYVSRWSLILPASNSGSTISVETIGQASTTPGQPFGSVSLSPKVIYREIATSDQIRLSAAQKVGLTPQQFGRVRVRLIDETLMMMFQITGGTPEGAQAKGRAINTALAERLDALRRDEFEKRATLVGDSLKIYQGNLDRARERIAEFQRVSGLISVNQFHEASSSSELLRRRLAERRAELEKALAEQVRLVSRIGFGPDIAAAGLRLTADPAFGRLAITFAEGLSAVRENELRYGRSHPVLLAAQMKRDGAIAEIEKIAAKAGLATDRNLQDLILIVGDAQHAELLRAMMTGDALAAGLRSEVEALDVAVHRTEAEVARMGSHASLLESLKKDLIVAEAVMTSAAARLDTNRTDVYSSYPMVQVLAEPELPEDRSQPRLLYAVAAGILGSFVVLLAWGAAWVRASFRRRRSKSV